MSKFTFILESPQDVLFFTQMCVSFGQVACTYGAGTGEDRLTKIASHMELSCLTVGEWAERKIARLGTGKTGKYELSIAEAFAFHTILRNSELRDGELWLDRIFTELDKWVVNQRGLRKVMGEKMLGDGNEV